MGNYGKIKPADQILIQSLVCKQKESETPGEIQRKVLHRGTIGVKSQQEDRHQQGKGRQRTDLLLVLSRQVKKNPNQTRPDQSKCNQTSRLSTMAGALLHSPIQWAHKWWFAALVLFLLSGPLLKIMFVIGVVEPETIRNEMVPIIRGDVREILRAGILERGWIW